MVVFYIWIYQSGKKSNTSLEHLGFHPVEGGGGTGGSEASHPQDLILTLNHRNHEVKFTLKKLEEVIHSQKQHFKKLDVLHYTMSCIPTH